METCFASYLPQKVWPHQYSPFPSRQFVTMSSRRAPRKYVRLVPHRDAIHLQTAVTTFEKTTGEHRRVLQVFSLLHIADASYYESIESTLKESTVVFELITSRSSTTNSGSSNLRSLTTPVAASPKLNESARSLGASAQINELSVTQPNWYLADVPKEQMTTEVRRPRKLRFSQTSLTIIASFLPWPELNAALIQAFFIMTPLTPFRVLQLLNTDLLSKRRLLYAWRAVSSTKVKANAQVPSDLGRNRIAWNAINEVKDSNVALLYGAWHTGWFCRRAEADGMQFVNQKWVTAMVLPRVEVHITYTIRWLIVLVLYGAYCGIDWVWNVEKLVQSLSGTRHLDVPGIFLYAVRHIGPFWAFRRWFDDWDTS